MKNFFRCVPGALAIAFAISTTVAVGSAWADEADDSSSSGQKTSRLPFMAEEARARGYDLPLPFGTSLVLVGLQNREIDVSDVRIGVNSNPPQSVNQYLNLGSTSNVFNANFKFDAWLLPFLNVYALAGYVHNNSTSTLHITLPRPGPIPGNIEYDTKVETELDGFVGGLGLTLAGGIGQFYGVLDCNYVQSDLGFDNAFNALIVSARAGWNGKLGALPVQLWLGVGDWDTGATATGHATLPNGDRLDFEADQHPHTRWIYDVGGNLSFSKRWQLFLDLGADFQGGYVFVVGPTYRF